MLSKNPNSPQIRSSLEKRTIVTPDFHELRLQVQIPVFVYGTLKSGRVNSKLLEGATYYGKAHTLTDAYIMKSAGSFPVVFGTNSSVGLRAHIRGELYGCGIEHLHVLDNLENNTIMYQRELRTMYLEEQDTDNGGRIFRGTSIQKAWMYIGIPEYWAERTLPTQSISRYGNVPALRDKALFQW